MAQDAFDKDLVTGSYDLVALHLLAEGPTYAYDMIRRISGKTRQLIRWREGTAYRVLHDLERRGLVAARWRGPKAGRRRCYYRLTERGRRALRERRRQWQHFRRTMDTLLSC